MSEGKWIAFNYLVILSHIIASVIVRGGGRILVSIPPRHGKSWFISQWIPVWFLSMWPGLKVILTTYEANFAATWGRRVRNIIKESGHEVKLQLSDDSTASNNWELTTGGGMITAGVGGPITGKGGHLLLCDDPHKNWQEAQSDTIRESIKDWYDSTFYTRAEPGATIVILHCMTGDTPVLMADGTEKNLKDIRVGDLVATYKKGRLGISKVENWINNGLSKVLTIKTTSGIVVKANERHPFLVNKEGVIKWKRVKDLRPGHEIYRVNGENGKVRHASQKDVINRRFAEDTAITTIMQNDGLMESVRHLAIRCRDLLVNLNIAMASHWNNIIKCIKRKMDAALSVVDMQVRRITHPVGAKSCASITATIREKYEACSATTATCSLNDTQQQISSKKRLITSDFILEKIESITYSGIEDVFDVQIAETENFIANGLVSHNTRWHEDDLIGYLMREKIEDGYFHIRMPAIAEDDDDILGRKPGEALCPERYDENALNRIKVNTPAMMWNALFQQRPAPMEGTIFLRKHWKFYKIPPQCNFVLQSWDTASKLDIKKKGSTAYSVCHTWGVSAHGAVLLDRWRDRVEYPQLRQQASIQYLKWRPNIILIEDRDTGQALLQSLQQETMYPLLPVYPDLDKVIRAQAVSPMQVSERLFLPDPTVAGNEWVGDFIDNGAMFPNTKYKDDIDAMSQALTFIMTMATSGQIMSCEKRRTTKLLEHFRTMM